MVKFLTDEWVSALDREARAHLSPIAETFVAEYRVQLETNDWFVYQIRFDDEGVTVRTGTPSPATVVAYLTADAANVSSKKLCIITCPRFADFSL